MKAITLPLSEVILHQLQLLAKNRGITVQEYLRAVVIPHYLDGISRRKNLGDWNKHKKFSLRVKKGWETRRKKQEELELLAKNEAADLGTSQDYPPYPAGPTQ